MRLIAPKLSFTIPLRKRKTRHVSNEETTKLVVKDFALIVLCHAFLFCACYLSFYFFGFINKLPDQNNLVQWDANWYLSVKNEGYQYFWYRASNAGFFPLFPSVWRLLQLESIGISVFNYFTFLTGLFLLCKTFQIRSVCTLCFISLPSVVFFFVPYTESLFFFFSALLLIGLYKNKQSLVLCALFFCSLTRGTAMLFIPALIVMEVLNSAKPFSRHCIKNILLYSFVSLAGLLVVVLVQYYTTYEWFAFAKQQVKFWNHKFSMPRLPFVSYGGDKIIWLDGLAFFFSLVAFAVVLVFFVKHLLKKKHPLFKNKAFWFSATYLLMVGVFCVFFNQKSSAGNTEIVGINRYVFCSAFFLVFLFTSLNELFFNLKTISVYLLVALVAWLCLGLADPLKFLNQADSYFSTAVFFALLTIYVTAFFALKQKKYGNYIAVVLFCCNVILSVHVLFLYITGNWVA